MLEGLKIIYPGGLPVAMSLVGCNTILTGFVVFLKRNDRAGFRFLIFSLAVSLWGIGLSFQLNDDLSIQVARWWGHFAQVCSLFIPATWLHFLLVYLKKEADGKRFLSLVYLVTLLIFPFTFTPLYVLSFREIAAIKQYPAAGPFYVAHTVLFASVIFGSLYFFYRVARNEKNPALRKDLKLLFWSSLYGFAVGSPAFLPVYGIPVPQFNLLLMPLWPFFLTFALIRYRLMDAEEMIAAFQREKLMTLGILTASMNHEIRNPLYIVQGTADTLNERLNRAETQSGNQIDPCAFRSSIQRMRDQATRAMETVNRFASFAKGRVDEEIRLEPVAVEKIVDDVLMLVAPELTRGKVTLIRDIPKDLPPVLADRHLLEEIFFNLIVNACQAMFGPQCDGSLPEAVQEGESAAGRPCIKEGSVLRISAEKADKMLVIRIQDNGPGISAEVQKNIFKPFYTTKTQGTGLGLYITRQLVEKNRGRIRVESEEGKGTVFVLEFN